MVEPSEVTVVGVVTTTGVVGVGTALVGAVA